MAARPGSVQKVIVQGAARGRAVEGQPHASGAAIQIGQGSQAAAVVIRHVEVEKEPRHLAHVGSRGFGRFLAFSVHLPPVARVESTRASEVSFTCFLYE